MDLIPVVRWSFRLEGIESISSPAFHHFSDSHGIIASFPVSIETGCLIGPEWIVRKAGVGGAIEDILNIFKLGLFKFSFSFFLNQKNSLRRSFENQNEVFLFFLSPIFQGYYPDTIPYEN